MNKRITDAMAAIIEEKMEQFKSDFYKFDMDTLKDYDGCFVWSVTPKHTRLELLNVFDIVDYLKESEIHRFVFMGSSDLSLGYGVSDDAECFKSQVYMYDGICLRPISSVTLNAVLTAIEVNVKDKIFKLFPEEIKYWHKRVPIHFSNRKVFSDFLQIARSEEGEKLLNCVRKFRSYRMNSMSHKIIIGSDFAPKSFSFHNDRGDGWGGYDGGIIYHEHLKDWSTHT